MAKKIKVIVAQGLKIGGAYPPVGSALDIDEKEARRLLDLGAVTLPQAKLEAVPASAPAPAGNGGGKKIPAPAAGDEAALIAQIQGAASLDALKALLTDEAPSEAVAAAAEARWLELEEAGKQ